MIIERVTTGERQLAIKRSELVLPNGEFANKQSLLQCAFEAGLPVPAIVPESLLPEYERLWAKIMTPGELTEDQFVLQYEKAKLYRRGFFLKPEDMWIVDTLPTTEVCAVSGSNEDSLALLSESTTSRRLAKYLKTNFDQPEIPQTGSFLQEPSSRSNYVSAWMCFDQIYGTISSSRPGVLSFVMEESSARP